MRLFGSSSDDFQRSPVSNRPSSVLRQVSARILSALSSSLGLQWLLWVHMIPRSTNFWHLQTVVGRGFHMLGRSRHHSLVWNAYSVQRLSIQGGLWRQWVALFPSRISLAIMRANMLHPSSASTFRLLSCGIWMSVRCPYLSAICLECSLTVGSW